MKILELFGGIGACSKALENLGIDFEIADYVEIDKYAVKSFNAMHNTNFEPQDICDWDKNIQVDLLMHGSPCQDFSNAGKQAGGDENSGTRSSLMYETIRIVNKLKPKYVVWENVKNLLSQKHKHNFEKYLKEMENFGYVNYYKVLNAKDYGIPQNRERVFTISIRNDIIKDFKFPNPIPLRLKLKDMLEEKVDEKYYLSDAMVKYISADNEKWTGNNSEALINKTLASTINTGEGSRRCDASNYVSDNFEENCDLKEVVRKYGIFDKDGKKHQAGSVYDKNGLPPTLDTMQGGYRQPCIETKNVYGETEKKLFTEDGNIRRYINSEVVDEFKDGQMATTSFPNGYGHGPRTHDESVALNTVDKPSVKYDFRIRKLIPLETWRLMGFDDEDFYKAKEVNSDTQLYKQAGNSIVVNVLEAILRELLYGNKM